MIHSAKFRRLAFMPYVPCGGPGSPTACVQALLCAGLATSCCLPVSFCLQVYVASKSWPIHVHPVPQSRCRKGICQEKWQEKCQDEVPRERRQHRRERPLLLHSSADRNHRGGHVAAWLRPFERGFSTAAGPFPPGSAPQNM